MWETTDFSTGNIFKLNNVHWNYPDGWLFGLFWRLWAHETRGRFLLSLNIWIELRGNNKLLSSWKSNKGNKRSCASMCVTLFCPAAVLTCRVIERPRRTFEFERYIVTCLATRSVVQTDQFQNLCWSVTQDDSDLLVAQDVSRQARTDERFWRRLASQTRSDVQLTPQTRRRTRTRRRRTRRETRQSCSR